MKLFENVRKLVPNAYGKEIWLWTEVELDHCIRALQFTTTVELRSNSLCIIATKELKKLGLDRGDTVKVTIER